MTWERGWKPLWGEGYLAMQPLEVGFVRGRVYGNSSLSPWHLFLAAMTFHTYLLIGSL
jgi:hypothetical protein